MEFSGFSQLFIRFIWAYLWSKNPKKVVLVFSKKAIELEQFYFLVCSWICLSISRERVLLLVFAFAIALSMI